MSCGWVSRHIGLIDTLGYGAKEAVAVYVVKGSEGAALIDAGYSPSWERVIKGLRELGVGLEEVNYLFLTHFHLDHAGASHKLLHHLPNATLIVHEGAIRHLIDPSRLVDAALAAFGDDLAPHIGDLKPIQPERIEPANETRYRLGGVDLEALFTPGHVPSHLSLYVEADEAVVTGDAVNVRYSSIPFPLPPASPPYYDVDNALKSLERIRALRPKILCTPHYGARVAGDRLFEEEERAISWWRDEVERMMDEGMDAEQITAGMRAKLLEQAGLKLQDLDGYARDILLTRLLKISVIGYMGFFMRRR